MKTNDHLPGLLDTEIASLDQDTEERHAGVLNGSLVAKQSGARAAVLKAFEAEREETRMVVCALVISDFERQREGGFDYG